MMISQALSPAFSAGNHAIGVMISNTHGLVISTYAPIHSNSPLSDSSNSCASTGGKNVVYASHVPFVSHLIDS
jgi:hypothetical protein